VKIGPARIVHTLLTDRNEFLIILSIFFDILVKLGIAELQAILGALERFVQIGARKIVIFLWERMKLYLRAPTP
jgi:hypothetical protein